MLGVERKQAVQERYVVWTTPTSAVRTKAQQKGCPEGEPASDYIDTSICDKRQQYPTLQAAISYCKNYIKDGLNWWGVCDVYRETFDPKRREWLRDYHWVVSDVGVEDEEPIED